MHPTAPAPDAVWARYGDTRHLVFLLLGVLVFAGLTAIGLGAFVIGDGAAGAEKAIGWTITGLFAACLLLCTYAAAVFPSRRHRLPGVAIDAAGIWWRRDRRVTLVPWPAVAGVGVSHLEAPSAAVAAGSSSGRRENFALEVFLRTPDPREDLRAWAVAEPAPTPALPAERLRFVTPAGSDRHDLRAAVERHAPRLWIGEYEREWTPLGMLGK